MLLCIRKRRLILTALMLFILAAIAALLLMVPDIRPAFAAQGRMPVTIIIDPGHGGEDGGAVSPDGVKESDINLAIALRLESLLRFTGTPTGMTRREDRSIHDPDAETIKAKKTSDLQNRTEMVNDTKNAILLSIHQNSLPSSPVTWGAQAFYNTDGEVLANTVQESLNTCINTHRAKQARAIGSGVYVMQHIRAPGILVECGFLSNTEETIRLQQEPHQKMITCAIAAGLLRGIGEKGTG